MEGRVGKQDGREPERGREGQVRGRVKGAVGEGGNEGA